MPGVCLRRALSRMGSHRHSVGRHEVTMRATKILVWGEWLLLIAGCSVLAYCASIELAAKYYQLRARETVAEVRI